MACSHEFWERESSVATEGYCPICMSEDNKRLRSALTSIVKKMESNGMGDWQAAKRARAALVNKR